MLAWLPIVGPIVQGVVDLFKSKNDTDVQKIKVKGEVWVKEAELQTQIKLSNARRKDLWVAEDIVIFPVVIMTALVTWDNIVAIPYPHLVWGVRPFLEGSGLTWLPYAVMVYLFGSVTMNKFKG